MLKQIFVPELQYQVFLRQCPFDLSYEAW